jgi:hypothetical protein
MGMCAGGQQKDVGQIVVRVPADVRMIEKTGALQPGRLGLESQPCEYSPNPRLF